MSVRKEDVICPVCVNFESQTWRKSLCKNCFHTKTEHSEGVGEAGAVAVTDRSDGKETECEITGLVDKENAVTGDTAVVGSESESVPSSSLPAVVEQTKTGTLASAGIKRTESVGQTHVIVEDIAREKNIQTSIKQSQDDTAGVSNEESILPTNSPASDVDKMATNSGRTVGGRQGSIGKVAFTLRSTATDRRASEPTPKVIGKIDNSKFSSKSGLQSKVLRGKDAGSPASNGVKSSPVTSNVHSKVKDISTSASVSSSGSTSTTTTTTTTATTATPGSSSVVVKKSTRPGGSVSIIKRLAKSFVTDDGTSEADQSPTPGQDKSPTADKLAAGSSEAAHSSKYTTAPTGQTGDTSSSANKSSLTGDKNDKVTKPPTSPTKTGTTPSSAIGSRVSPATTQTGKVSSTSSTGSPSKLSTSKYSTGSNAASQHSQAKHAWKTDAKPTTDKSSISSHSAASRPSLASRQNSLEKTKQSEDISALKTTLLGLENRCIELEKEKCDLTAKLSLCTTSIKENERKVSEASTEASTSEANLRTQLLSLEGRCSDLHNENIVLMERVVVAQREQQLHMASTHQGNASEELKNQLEETQDRCETLYDENETLKQAAVDLRQEMEEMYDQFREGEIDEFREIQKELDITAKNCRVLQFKLRKSERRSQQADADRQQAEERLRNLEGQCADDAIKKHIQTLEDELHMAKGVSVRLHDELDLAEEKRTRAEEENGSLQDLLVKTDKQQYRMEIEIDKLRDQIEELHRRLRDAETQSDITGRQGPLIMGDRKRDGRSPLVRQGSKEQDISQLLRDLCDSMERENDVKDQLRFCEQEIKTLRKKVSDLEDENENLNHQLKKVSYAKMTRSPTKTSGDFRDGRDEDDEEEEVLSERSMQLKLELELSEREASVLRKKLVDFEEENEALEEELQQIKFLLQEKEKAESMLPEPSSPTAYYEDKIKELVSEMDDLRWKLIEKERENETLTAQANIIQSRRGVLRKTKSLDSDYQATSEITSQLELVDDNAKDKGENGEQILDASKIPVIQTDDAAIRNIELRDRVRYLEHEKSQLKKTLWQLTQHIHVLTTSSSLQPLASLEPVAEEQADTDEDMDTPPLETHIFTNKQFSRDTQEQLHVVEKEAESLKTRMREMEVENTRLSHELERIRATSLGQESDGSSPDQTAERQDTLNDFRQIIREQEEEISEVMALVKTRDKMLAELECALNKMKYDVTAASDKARIAQQELEMAQQKNQVLSNLLELVTDRADVAEVELQSVLNNREALFTRSPSQVSQSQYKKKVESLEHQLAEERQKTAAADRKLAMVGEDTLSSAMSDDVKLRLREKQLLQNELNESRRHLLIANDQIKGLKERLDMMEDSHKRLRADYQAIEEQLDSMGIDWSTPTPSGTGVIKASRTSLPVAKAPILPRSPPRSRSGSNDTGFYKVMCDQLRLKCEQQQAEHKVTLDKIMSEIAKYKLKSEELEYKVDEINEIWVSKSGASEREKQDLEKQLDTCLVEVRQLRESVHTAQAEMRQKEGIVSKSQQLLKDKDVLIQKREEIIQQQDDLIKQRDGDFQALIDQISQRDETIRDLHEAMRIRDERLREKDDIMKHMNTTKHEEVHTMEGTIRDSVRNLQLKEDEILALKTRLHEAESFSVPHTGPRAQDNSVTIEGLLRDRENMRRELSRRDSSWQIEKSRLISEMDKLKHANNLLESMSGLCENEALRNVREDNIRLAESKLALVGQMGRIQTALSACVRSTDSDAMEINAETIEIVCQRIGQLKQQAELSYRREQEEKLLKAELLTLKVRYETRLEKIQRDYSRLQVMAESLQNERDLHRDLVRGVQRGMSELRARYSQDCIRWQEERLMMEDKLKEMDDGRKVLVEMKRFAEDLQRRVIDQERTHTDASKAFDVERNAWLVERDKLVTHTNQLEENFAALASNNDASEEGVQTRLMSAWQQEREDKGQLLDSSHRVSTELRQLLNSRHKEFTDERAQLVAAIEAERKEWAIQRKTQENTIQEGIDQAAKLMDQQKKNTDLQDRLRREREGWQKERIEFVRHLTESRQYQTRQSRRVGDILHLLKRLRELSLLVTEMEVTQPSGADQNTDPQYTAHAQLQKGLDLAVLKYIRESVVQLSSVIEELAQSMDPANVAANNMTHLRRSTSTNQIQAELEESREGLLPEPQIAGQTFASPSAGLAVDHTEGQDMIEIETPVQQLAVVASVSLDSAMNLSDPFKREIVRRDRVAVSKTTGRPGLNFNRKTRISRSVSPTPLTLVRKITNYPDPPPSFIISPSHSKKDISEVDQLESLMGRGTKPHSITKSISVDSAPISSFLAMYPTQEAIDECQHNGGADHFLSPPRRNSDDRLSPRTTRRKFFEDQPLILSSGYSSWSDRRTPQLSPVGNVLPQPFTLDAAEVRRAVEEQLLYGGHAPQLHGFEGPYSAPGSMSTKTPETQSLHDHLELSTELSHLYAQITPHSQRLRADHSPQRGPPLPSRQSEPRSTMTWNERVQIVDNTGTDPGTNGRKGSKSSTLPATSIPSYPTNERKSATLGSKDKRKQLRKASSQDDPSIEGSIASANVKAMSPGAPTGFGPSDLLAVVKRKLRPVMKKTMNSQDESRKSGSSRGSSSAMPDPDISTATETDGHAAKDDDTVADGERGCPLYEDITPMTPLPRASLAQDTVNVVAEPPLLKFGPSREPSRLLPPQPSSTRQPPERWRSRSAERGAERRSEIPRRILQQRGPQAAHVPGRAHGFSETAV